MRGRLVTPSGMVPPPLEEDFISSSIMSVPVSLDSVSVSSVGGVGVLGPPNPSLGQFSDPIRPAFDQSRARGAPGFGNFHDSPSGDIRNVAPSPSPSFNPSSLLFPMSDSGFASLPTSVPSSSSAFSLPLPSSSAPSFSSLVPSALPLFTLPLLLFLLFSLFPLLPRLPLFLFSCLLILSTLLLLLPLRLLLFLRFLPLLFLRLLFALLVFRLCSIFLRLLSLPLLWFRLLLSPLSSSASLLSSFEAPPGFPPVSFLSSSSLSSSSSVGDIADFQARVLGLSAEYQALGHWFVASHGFGFSLLPCFSLSSPLF